VRIGIPSLSTKFRIRFTVDIMFYLGLAFYLVTYIISTSFYLQFLPSAAIKLGYYCCTGCILYKELIYLILEKYKAEHYFGFFVAMLLVVICWRISGLRVAGMFLLVYSARTLDFKEIARFCVILTGIMLIFVIASSYAGIIKDYIRIEETRVRHYLGFRYCLFPSTYLFNITALILYIRKEKVRVLELAFLFVLNYIMYLLTGSRLTFVTALLLLVIVLWLKYRPFDYNKKHRLLYYAKWVFVLLFVFSFIICWNYDITNRIYRTINTLLEGRISLAHMSLQQFGIKLFGSNVQWIGNGLGENGKQTAGIYSYVDNFYLNFLQRYGTVAFGIVLIILTIVMQRFYQKKDYYAIIIFGLLAFHGLIDDLILYISYNTFWLLCGEYLLSRREVPDIFSYFQSQINRSGKRRKKWLNLNH